MKLLLFLAGSLLSTSGAYATTTWNNKIEIVAMDNTHFDSVSLVHDNTTFFGNGSISGHVKLKIGINVITCDSAIVEDNEVIIYNPKVISSRHPSEPIEADILKLDTEEKNGFLMSGYIFYKDERHGELKWNKFQFYFTDADCFLVGED